MPEAARAGTGPGVLEQHGQVGGAADHGLQHPQHPLQGQVGRSLRATAVSRPGISWPAARHPWCSGPCAPPPRESAPGAPMPPEGSANPNRARTSALGSFPPTVPSGGQGRLHKARGGSRPQPRPGRRPLRWPGRRTPGRSDPAPAAGGRRERPSEAGPVREAHGAGEPQARQGHRPAAGGSACPSMGLEAVLHQAQEFNRPRRALHRERRHQPLAAQALQHRRIGRI
jgi:hypothetical protein